MRLHEFHHRGDRRSILLVLLAVLFILTVPVKADTTLEILNLKFPEKCGAVYNQDISTCPRCHASRSDGAQGWATERKADHNLNFRTLTSLEQEERITVFIPAVELKPGQPFKQIIRFRGKKYYYQYGYRKNHGPFHELDSRWIYGSSKEQFLEEHDGTSLPLLKEPGEYVFMVKLLYDRHATAYRSDYRWEEVVLLWPISVYSKD